MRKVEASDERGALEVDHCADRAPLREEALRLALRGADEILGRIDVRCGAEGVTLHPRQIEQVGDQSR